MAVYIRASRVVALALLSLALALAGSWSAGPAAANPANYEDAVTSVPYQGRLTGNDGQAVADGAYDFKFSLYDAESGGAPLWTETQTGVIVQDGYFGVLLGDVAPLGRGIAAQERYLAVAVRGPGDSGFTALEPRQKLVSPQADIQQPNCPTGAGADHDHCGDAWSCTGSSAVSWSGLKVSGPANTGRLAYHHKDVGSSVYYGVFGEATGAGSAGVRGEGGTYGVFGDGTTYGVYGTTSGGSDTNSGVKGSATSSSGKVYGVWGQSDSSSTHASGVVGTAMATSGETHGVWGETKSSGVNAAGVYGIASSTTGDVKGVVGATWSTNGGVAVVGTSWGGRHAGWFESMGAFESVKVRNNGASSTALWVDNVNSGGPLIGAGNGSDTEFWLDGTGNLYIDGTLYENQGDYADMLPAVDDLEPGDVLIIGSDGKLTRSTQANQTSVAGIYSTDPGIVGRPFNPTYDEDDPANEGGWPHEAVTQLASDEGASAEVDANMMAAMFAELDKGFVPLAMAGVVPVKVSAENGPIQPGDLLTTSSLPGHAMKAAPVDVGGVEFYLPGTIIGKALEPLEEGTGLIYALVALQ